MIVNKLQKKEWFTWFAGTTLDSITEWFKYYYIDPEHMKYISRYNIWDEEWELGLYDSSTGAKISNSSYVRSANAIKVSPNEVIYLKAPYQLAVFQYDVNGVYLGTRQFANNTTITIPSDCHYIRFFVNSTSYGTTYNHDICINESDPDFNGRYEPHIIDIDDVLGVINLGSMNWTDSTDGWSQSFSLQGYTKAYQNNAVANILAFGYTSDSANNVFNHLIDKSISINSKSVVQLYNSEFANKTATEIKAALTDVYLIYIKIGSPL